VQINKIAETVTKQQSSHCVDRRHLLPDTDILSRFRVHGRSAVHCYIKARGIYVQEIARVVDVGNGDGTELRDLTMHGLRDLRALLPVVRLRQSADTNNDNASVCVFQQQDRHFEWNTP